MSALLKEKCRAYDMSDEDSYHYACFRGVIKALSGDSSGIIFTNVL